MKIDVTGLTTLKGSELKDGMVVTWGYCWYYSTVEGSGFKDGGPLDYIVPEYTYYLHPDHEFNAKLEDLLG